MSAVSESARDVEYISGNTDPQLVESVVAGIRVLEGLGAEMVPIQMPDPSDYIEAWGVLCASEALAAHEATYPSRRADYGPWFQGWLDKGAAVTGAEYAKANNVRSACRGLLNNVFENVDVIACPTMTTPPLPHYPRGNVRAHVFAGRPQMGPIHGAIRFQRRSYHILALWPKQ